MYRKQADIGTGHDIRLTPKKAQTEHRMRQDMSRLRDPPFVELADTLGMLNDVDLEEAYKMVCGALGFEFEAEDQAQVEKNGAGNSKENQEQEEEGAYTLPRLFTPDDEYASLTTVLATHPMFKSIARYVPDLDEIFRQSSLDGLAPAVSEKVTKTIDTLSNINAFYGACIKKETELSAAEGYESPEGRDRMYSNTEIGGCFRTWDEIGGAASLRLLREVCNLATNERRLREAPEEEIVAGDRERGKDKGRSKTLEEVVLKELIENLLGSLGVRVEEILEKSGGNEGGTAGGNEGGEKAKTTVGETGKKDKKEKTKEEREKKNVSKLKPYKDMTRQDWKKRKEGWVRGQMVNLTVDAILMQMDHLALKPQELRGNGPGGWKGKAGMKKAQVVDACVACIME